MATVTLTKDNFEDKVTSHEIVLIDFWAAWCGPCKTFAPIFEAASEKHPDILFGKVDTEAQPELAAYFGVSSIPTLIVFREKIMLLQNAGVIPEAAIDDVVEKVRQIDMDDVRKQLEEEEEEEEDAST